MAAHHPATAAVGRDVVSAGGSAVDAVVAMCLAACVGETTVTGLGGGGFATVWDAERGEAELYDFFVAVPGIGLDRPTAPTREVPIALGDATIPYLVGPATAAVPGMALGLGAFHAAHGRTPWPELVAPARRLAADGVPLRPKQAELLGMLAALMCDGEGAPIYAPEGRPLRGGEAPVQPAIVHALDLLADEGPSTWADGTCAQILLALMEERGGAITADDLATYQVLRPQPLRVRHAGVDLVGRRDLNGYLATIATLPDLAPLDAAGRARATARALRGGDADGHTTNCAAVDREGNACVATTSLGLGSGDWLPGLAVHLNSMLGETELIRPGTQQGDRMGSMMVPHVALDGDGLVLAAGAAGGSRIRSALTQVVAGVLDEGLAAQDAVSRPRLHRVGDVVHAEPGYPEEGLAALEAEGLEVQRWTVTHHYFGGASGVGRAGAGGDPRRDGVGLLL